MSKKPDSPKTALESRHKKACDARGCDRIKAVFLVSKGWAATSIAQSIAQALRKSGFSIGRSLDDYLKKEKVKPEIDASLISRINDKFQMLNPAL